MSAQKPILCNGCSARIKFDNSVRSSTGKMIPLDFATSEKHNCPARQNGEYQKAAAKTAKEYPSSDRSADIAKAHAENMAASAENTKALLTLAATNAKLTDVLDNVVVALQDIRNQMQIANKGGVKFQEARSV